MEESIFAEIWQLFRPILAYLLMIGPFAYLASKARKYVDPAIIDSLDESIRFSIQFLVLSPIADVVLGYHFDFQTYEIEVMVVLGLAGFWEIWKHIPEKYIEFAKILLRWLLVLSILLWLTKNKLHKYDIHSWRQLFDMIGEWGIGVLSSLYDGILFIFDFLFKLNACLETPGYLLGSFVPVVIFMNWDRLCVGECLSNQTKRLLSFFFEVSLASIIIACIFHRVLVEPICLLFVSSVIVISVEIARLTWHRTDDKLKIWIRRFIKVTSLPFAIIVILQVVFDINFMVAANMMFRQAFLGFLIFCKRTFIGKFLFSQWNNLLVLVKKYGLRGLSGWIVSLFGKLSFRYFVKAIIMFLTLKLLSIKPVKRFIRQKTGKIGERAILESKRFKVWISEISYFMKAVVFILIMWAFWSSPWEIIWPMIPNGTLTRLSYVYRALLRGAIFILKKMIGNKGADAVVLFFARRMSNRISRLSPRVKEKVRMYMKWEIGRRLIIASQKNQGRFDLMSEKIRDVNRRARQIAIDQSKAYKNGDLGMLSVFGKTITETGKLASSFTKESLIGTAKFAKESARDTLTDAEKQTSRTLRLIMEIMREAFQSPKPDVGDLTKEKMARSTALAN